MQAVRTEVWKKDGLLVLKILLHKKLSLLSYCEIQQLPPLEAISGTGKSDIKNSTISSIPKLREMKIRLLA